MDTRFLNAVRGTNQGRPPVWLMRQAGRYLPEYQQLRAKYSFWEMCHEPDLITEVTQLPLRRYPLDAAVLFSDILFIPEVLGCGVQFVENIGPVLERSISRRSDIQQLPRPDVQDCLSMVYSGIRQLKHVLEVPLLGFCGGAFTVASYMIEGRSSRDLARTKQWMFQDPEGFHELLQLLTDLSIQHLKNQVEAGADAVQVFDSWAHTLAYSQFMEFSLPYMRQMVDALRSIDVPVILFCRGSSVFYEELASAQPAGVSIDWNADLAQVRSRMGPSISLQGNLDPQLLCAEPEVVARATKGLLTRMQGDPAFIVNLGHGILPQSRLDAVDALVQTVHNFVPATV